MTRRVESFAAAPDRRERSQLEARTLIPATGGEAPSSRPLQDDRQ